MPLAYFDRPATTGTDREGSVQNIEEGIGLRMLQNRRPQRRICHQYHIQPFNRCDQYILVYEAQTRRKMVSLVGRKFRNISRETEFVDIPMVRTMQSGIPP